MAMLGGSDTPYVWNVESTVQFDQWWAGLTPAQQDSVDSSVRLLEEKGPTLDYPHSSDIRSSRHGNMRELRVQSGGRPLRIFYAFDPRRTAVLLIGGDKTGNNRFYARFVRRADELYDQHLARLRREGLIR